MDDLILKYYESEMRYLREAGREFARAHPDRAALLNLDRVGDRDPYVERLFEAFAFLTGKLRQKLDDDYPELTEGLVSLLWPHYLRMIPSLTILEFTPKTFGLQKTEELAAGAMVRSGPVGPLGVRCPYRSVYPVTLNPLSLTRAGCRMRPDGRSVIGLRFAFESQAKIDLLDLSRLRLFINADPPIAFTLRHFLTKEIAAISLRRPGGPLGEELAELPGVRFEAVGFAPEERLWPKADNAFGGYQLLLEYFCFREKFLFLDLCGLSAEELAVRPEGFEIEILLKSEYPAEEMPFSETNLRLFCAPAINLFELEAEPLKVDHHESEYKVIPILSYGGHVGEHVETYAVEEVTAFDHGLGGERREYLPFASFRHRGGMLRHEKPERYYHSRVRRGASGLFETWLMLGGQAWEDLEDFPKETLSLKVLGTNGMLPKKALREAQITELVSGVSTVESARNQTPPTLPCYPPQNDRFHWRVLSHLAPNYLSLMDAEVLRGTLALYDWTEGELNRRRLSGIVKVEGAPALEVAQGCVRRGLDIRLTLDSHKFAGQGDLTLFGELMSRFFAAYADMNMFTRLTVLSLPKGEELKWPAARSASPCL